MREVVVVKVLSGTDRDGLMKETLEIDGKEVMSAGSLSECPEDAILERDLLGPSDFAHLLNSFLIEHKGKQVQFVYEDMEDEE
ncbi:hypothetical protein [Paenibacillus sinopodophylli]|uniref:hypothetical protein n=1 Tax=Paenibacillus sinopodophylli TaxID=1837342 RepID=UPI00110C8D6A|nr:hypothetical protein [Paenibacillus sinopodophylli]